MTIAAKLIVQCLENEGVKYVFGIPGAKIDALFDALKDSSIELILCRHEQNAVFMAAMYGRLTEKPGVVLVTSGPGVGNLVTGLLTATTESDPVVAIGGAVALSMQGKSTHQSADNVGMLKSVTRYCTEVTSANALPEVMAQAFHTASCGQRGSVFISLPQDLLREEVAEVPLAPIASSSGIATGIDRAIALLETARSPLLLLGEAAARNGAATAVRAFLERSPLPVACTFEAAGIVPKEREEYFVGRLGLFHNQPGDALLSDCDLLVTVGFDPVEYDPEIWNVGKTKEIVHIHHSEAVVRSHYTPTLSLIGDIAATVDALTPKAIASDKGRLLHAHEELYREIERGKTLSGDKVHPLRFIYELHRAISPEATILCDIGSVYMWMARYYLIYEPHHLLFSNGQQTLGVALPWAVAATLARPNSQVVSLSGDGGFLFSATELETAVRCKRNFVHFVWSDGSYNMVAEQQKMKYHRTAGIELGPVDIPLFAKAFGATGFSVKHSDELGDIMQEAFATKGPVLVNIPIDYSDNPALFASTNPEGGH